jgi:polygalacturonase
MATWPTRGQRGPQYWDQQLKTYVDSGDAAVTLLAEAAQDAADEAQATADTAQAEVEALRPVFVLATAFGATGDGVTNDTAAIQAAIDSLATTGGVVFLPPGTYQVTDAGGSLALSLATSNVTLRGAGAGATVIRGFGTPAHIIGLTGTGCIVEHLTINGGADGDYSVGVHGIRMQGIGQKVRHAAITNCRAYGIGVGQGVGSTAQGVRIDDVDISNTGNDSIDTKNRTDTNADIIYSRITARTWGQNPANATQAGIDCRGPVKVTDVTVYPTGDQVGIRFREGELGATNGYGAHDASISQFHVVASGSTSSVGVYVAARHVMINAGHISGTHQGIDLIDGYAQITSVTVRNCVTNGFRFRIAGSSSAFSTASGCAARDCGTGFRIEAPNVVLDRCLAHGATAYGIDISTAVATDTVLRDCDLNNNANNVRDTGTSTHATNVRGWKTRGRVTAEVAIDSTGTKVATIAHGLNVTPSVNDVLVSLSRVTAVSDPAFGYLWCESTTGVNVVVRLRVSTASVTAGAVVRIVVDINARP